MSLKRHFSDSEKELDQAKAESPPKKLAQNVEISPTTKTLEPKLPPCQRSQDSNVNKFSSPTTASSKTSSGIAIKLGAKSDSNSSQAPIRPKVAAVFNADDSSDEEEMPMEAKMRMRNMGRETITSSGPNSFGKTKRGFTDTNKLFERQLKEAMDEVSNDHK